MNLPRRFLERLRRSPLRRLTRPLEALARPLLLKRSRILLGPLRGAYFPTGGLRILLNTYEPEVQRALEENLPVGGVFFDVGAHWGYLSLLAAHLVGPGGHVYAFEPWPANCQVFTDVMRRNGVHHCTLLRAAVSDAPGQATLYRGKNSYRASLLSGKEDGQMAVDVVSLDHVAATCRPPDLVKVDVEGAEDQVLRGAGKLLAESASPVWVIEVHSEEKDRVVRAALEAQGYHVDLLRRLPSRQLYPRNLVARRSR